MAFHCIFVAKSNLVLPINVTTGQVVPLKIVALKSSSTHLQSYHKVPSSSVEMLNLLQGL